MSAPDITTLSKEINLSPGVGISNDIAAVIPTVTVPPGSVCFPSGNMGDQPHPVQSASLYVGDIGNEVNEDLLFEVFNAVGPVSSIYVCRDNVTHRSLGYAYVNFHHISDAERALDTMNYTEIKGKPCRIMWSQRDPSLRRSGVGNIFVKNLNESIDNKQLYDTFSLFGNILSCKVVTDRESGLSKGYGYVHYETSEDAHAAIEKLNGMLIDGHEVEVGEFMRSIERYGDTEWTNCYVKNIPREWDEAKLKEEFSKFGEVISASISMGPNNHMSVKENCDAISIHEEENENSPASKEMEHGEVDGTYKEENNPAIGDGRKSETKELSICQEKSTSLGFGFVNFVEHEFAVEAIEQLNGKEVETVVDDETRNQTLYVGRAQKKGERQRELRNKFEAQKIGNLSKFQGLNLYIKNLDDSVTDDVLRDEFSDMGTITSVRVMKDIKTERSKGFGFVCYSKPEEATRAINEMNGKLIANKPIFVTHAQRKDERRAQLEALHNQRICSQGQQMVRGGSMNGSMGYHSGNMPIYMQHPGSNVEIRPTYPILNQVWGAPSRGDRGGYLMMPPQGHGNYPIPSYGVMHQQGGRGGRVTNNGRGGGRQGRACGQIQRSSGGDLGSNGQKGVKFNQQARNALSRVTTTLNSHQQHVGSHEVLTATALASASPEMQKNMIGERLYPLIHNTQPELTGKITGMLLEMDNSELLHLLESPEDLNAKISEALRVLEEHNRTGE